MNKLPLNQTLLEDFGDEISEVKDKQIPSQRAKYLVAPYLKQLADGKVEDRITAMLEGEIKEKYIEALNWETRFLLAKSLYGVGRWSQDGVGQIIDPNFVENNLDHVEELLQWLKEIERDYPNLMKVVTNGDKKNWLDLYKMVIPHDNGEIIMGDMPRAHHDFNEKKGKIHKRKEAWAGRRLFDLHMKPEQAEEYKALYTRWDKREPDDMLVNLGHMLDKGQASQNVAKHVVPFNLGEPFFEGTLEGVDAPMKYLERMQSLPKEARKELLALAEDKIFKNWVRLETPWIVVIVDDTRRRLGEMMER